MDVLKPILPVWVRLGWESQSSENCSYNSVYCFQGNSAVHNYCVNECEVTRAEGESQKMVSLGLYPSSQLIFLPLAPFPNQCIYQTNFTVYCCILYLQYACISASSVNALNYIHVRPRLILLEPFFSCLFVCLFNSRKPCY